jgi:hypothetical protein
MLINGPGWFRAFADTVRLSEALAESVPELPATTSWTVLGDAMPVALMVMLAEEPAATVRLVGLTVTAEGNPEIEMIGLPL